MVLESYAYDQTGMRLKKVEGARVTYYVNPYYEEEQRKLVFFSKRDNTYGEIYTMNADGSGLMRLTNNSVEDAQPAWSPDGRKIAFFSKRDHANGEIYVMNADGTNVVRLTNNTVVDKDPAWSPDGTKIAFASWASGNGDIYIIPAGGGTATKLTGGDSTSEDSWPAWSPDGSKIAFYSARSGAGDIYTVAATGGTATKLSGANSTSQDAQPAWSPDGSKIAFRSARSGAGDIYMVPATGGTATKLGGNHASYNDAHPVWPAPGGEVLFASWRAGGGNLYRMPASSTGSATALSGNHSSAEDSHPDWQAGVSYPSANTIKHYYAGGQRIATRDSEGLKFIHVDHLRSTSRVTNPSGVPIRTIRYDPWGYTQAGWGSGTAAVKYTYTGKEQDSTGLYYYGARYYDSALGRFVQPDTIVPQPGNPQALNRYAYVLNNPLRYIDPTGYFTEEQIMAYFGVKTWEEVLAFFRAGGALEGRWGWLETLRTAELGDVIQFFNNYEGLWPAWLGADVIAEGVLVEQEGQLYIQSGDTLIAASEAAWWGNAFGVRRPSSPSGLMYFGPYNAEITYYHLQFDPAQVDWVGIGLDATGIVADAISYGMGGRATNAVQVARAAEQTGVLINVVSLLRTGIPLAVDLATGDASLPGGIDFALDVAGVYMPFVPDAISLVWGVSRGLYYTP